MLSYLSAWSLVKEPAGDAAVRINATVPQERPVLTSDFYLGCIEIRVQYLFLVM
jgi:hypothetical protein